LLIHQNELWRPLPEKEKAKQNLLPHFSVIVLLSVLCDTFLFVKRTNVLCNTNFLNMNDVGFSFSPPF